MFKSSNDDNYNDFSSDWGVKRPAGLANGKSYIRFNKVAFRRSLEDVSEEEEEEEEENTTTNNNNNNNDDENNNYSGLVQAVVFEVNDRDLVGYVTEDGGRRYCCDEALAKTSGCSPGRVIVRPKKEMQEQNTEMKDRIVSLQGTVEAQQLAMEQMASHLQAIMAAVGAGKIEPEPKLEPEPEHSYEPEPEPEP